MSTAPTRVFIVGGGLAGIAAAEQLAAAAVDVRLIGRHNHHMFQPLSYRKATTSTSPADVRSPIRTMPRGRRNCRAAKEVTPC
jgi:NADH dehydrogenase FAD-containing subunit